MREPGMPEEIRPLREVVAGYVERSIAACHGNRALAARKLGVSRGKMYRILRAGPVGGSEDKSTG